MPSKRYVFTRSSILFRPQSGPEPGKRPIAGTDAPVRKKLVEAPGTAPGSDTFIARSFIAIVSHELT